MLKSKCSHKMAKVLIAVGLGSLLLSCARVVTHSSREITMVDKARGVMVEPSEGDKVGGPAFVRRRDVTAIPAQDLGSATGSLYDMERPQNYLYTTQRILRVGERVEVAVVPIVSVKKDAQDPAPRGESTAAVAESSNAKKPVADELIDALPDLAPPDSTVRLAESLTMTIAEIDPKGDVLLTFGRRSHSEIDDQVLNITARVERGRLEQPEGISVRDLKDIQWFESSRGEQLERQSAQWTDEFSLRASGFSEARSRIAQDLDAKRMRLTEIQDLLRRRIESHVKERETMAKERDKYLDLNRTQAERLAELEKKLEEQGESARAKDDTASSDPEASKDPSKGDSSKQGDKK